MNIRNLILDILVIVLMILGIINYTLVDIPWYIMIPLASICIIIEVYRLIEIIIKKKKHN